jgi:chaperonin GroES
MNVEPLGDNIVVKRLEADQTTAGGIVLPEAAREETRQGRVLSVGDGKRLPDGSRAGNQVKEGDRVVFAQFAGTDIVVDNEELLIMSEDDILAVLD